MIKRVVAKPGDVFSILLDGGRSFEVVFLCKNMFGYAFGIVGERISSSDFLNSNGVLRYPVHTGISFTRSGKWKRAGTRRDLLALFPEEPEIFHSKKSNPDNPAIGPFGSGEKASNELRQLSEEENRELRLNTTYRQIMLEEEVETYLGRTVRSGEFVLLP